MAKTLFLFKNTRAVVKAEKAIRIKNIKCLIVPVPKNISSECGMCIEAEEISSLKIDEVLKLEKIPFNKS